MLSWLASGDWLRAQESRRAPQLAIPQDKLVRDMIVHMSDEGRSKLRSSVGRLAETMPGGTVRVGTACSGCELVRVVCGQLAGALQDVFPTATPLKFSNEWACESEPWKQKFLVDNFGIEHLYGDIGHLSGTRAPNVAQDCTDEEIAPVNLLVVGFSCKDLSSQKTLDQLPGAAVKKKLKIAPRASVLAGGEGSSAATLHAALALIAAHTPQAVILENVAGLASDSEKEEERPGKDVDVVVKNKTFIEQSFAQIGYSFHLQILNASDRGIPQNRKRAYMIAIRLDGDRCAAELNEAVAQAYASVGATETVPVPDFFLSEEEYSTHWEWRPKCQVVSEGLKWVADHGKYFRKHGVPWPPEVSQVEEACGRGYTQAAYGTQQQISRREAEIIAFHVATTPEQEHSLEEFEDVSQSIDRVTVMVDQSPCQTPNQRTFLRKRKRFLCGEEALRLQGLWLRDAPKIRSSSDRQLHELAGNAFCSMSVAHALVACLSVM